MSARQRPFKQHGYITYTRGCRCDICRAAKAEYSRKQRAAASERRANEFTKGRYTVPDITHGYSGYANYGCRCWQCTEAKAFRGKLEYWRKKVRR